MADLQVAEELWFTAILPEGVLERWYVTDGTQVEAGEAVAAVRIGDALHDVVSPEAGRLTVLMPAGEIVDPGTPIARIHA